jgi:LacI family transcriptional regulator
MATIREVAAKAGVSVSTVSHVVNETRFVSEETRGRVLAAMEELHYKPNRLARSLRRKDKRTHTLGLLIPDSTNPFFAEVLRGVEDASFEAGYNVILCNSDDDPEKELNYLNVLLGKQVDGIVLVSAGAHEASLELLARRQGTAVVVDREIGGAELDSVVVDNEEGGYLATQYLLDLGHEHIGCITGPSPLTPSAGRSQGYRKALEDAGFVPDDNFLLAGDFRPQSGYTATRQLLAQTPRPTAIFACNDMMAVGAIRALNEAGLRVPQDVSVIGFDDITLASFTGPPLTTMAQPSIEMGMLAAELLVDRLQNPNGTPRRELLATTLVVRESCQALEG